MLLPKKTKHRKVRIGKNRGQATRGNYIAFGDFALQSQSNERIKLPPNRVCSSGNDSLHQAWR